MSNCVTITVPTADNQWHYVYNDTILPANYLLKFEIYSPGWAVILGSYGSHFYASYRIGVDINSKPFFDYYDHSNTSSFVALYNGQENALYDSGKVTIAFRRYTLGDRMDGQPWHSVALLVNDHFALSYAMPAQRRTGKQLGLGHYANTTERSFDNISIPELTEFVDWTSLDPNEPPIGGLERAVEGRYIKWFVRHNGTLRAWIPKPTPSVASYALMDIYNHRHLIDVREILTHVRQHGAYVYADYIDHELVKIYGHRYAEVNNPYLMNEDDCRIQAELTIRRQLEAATSEDFTTEYNPLLEPEDHITSPTGERIVNGINVSHLPTHAQQDLNLRGYIYGA